MFCCCIEGLSRITMLMYHFPPQMKTLKLRRVVLDPFKISWLDAIVFTQRALRISYHTSHLTRHTSHVKHHTSHFTHHTSHITRHIPSLNMTASSRFKPSSDTDAEGLASRLARLVDSSHNSEPELKGFLPLGDSSTLVTACSEEKPAIWTLNIDLQSSLKADLPFREKTVSSSNVLKLLFYGPHARDSCKIWDAAIHRVAHFASVKWAQWELKVRFLLIKLGENWSTGPELAGLVQRDGEFQSRVLVRRSCALSLLCLGCLNCQLR